MDEKEFEDSNTVKLQGKEFRTGINFALHRYADDSAFYRRRPAMPRVFAV